MRWINPLHLRSFYLVVRHGGQTASLPHHGYSLQQSSLSEQLSSLRDQLGVTLFHGDRFQRDRLTLPGELLYRHIAPFFEALEPVLDAIAHAGKPHLRIGAAEVVLAEYFPQILADLRAATPDLRFHLQSGPAAERVEAVRQRKLDLAIVAPATPPPDLATRVLLRLPVVLLVPKGLSLPADPAAWPRTLPPLIVPTEPAVLPERFDAFLKTHRLTWHPRAMVSSIGLVSWYVAKECAVGLTLGLPKLIQHSGLRAVRLDPIPPIEVSALWLAPATPLVTALLAALERHAPLCSPALRCPCPVP